MAFELKPVLENYGMSRRQLSPESRIAVGFGMAALKKGEEYVWMEDHHEYEDCMTVAQAEELAKADPDHDWRIVIHGPLRGTTHQRQGEMQWMLIERNEGFA